MKVTPYNKQDAGWWVTIGKWKFRFDPDMSAKDWCLYMIYKHDWEKKSDPYREAWKMFLERADEIQHALDCQRLKEKL